jgi:hypothetical protein
MPAARMPSPERYPAHARLLAGRCMVLLLGIWLITVPLAWAYGGSESWLDAKWNDMIVGIALASIGLIRLIRPVLPATTPILVTTLGIWLITAPLLAGYGFGADSTPATVNDVLAGTIATSLGVLRRV